MVTIYLDKQIFSYLFKSNEAKYKALKEKILSHKDDFIFLYSDAHLFDLQKDNTERKFAEMEFMQEIVDSNRLMLDGRKVDIVKDAPKDIFDTLKKVGDIDVIDFSQLDTEQINMLSNAIDLFIKGISGQLDVNWLSDREPIHVDKLQVNQEFVTSILKCVANSLYCQKEPYKLVRDNIKAKYNPTIEIADNNTDFNDKLKNAPLRLSFIDTIKASLKQMGRSSDNDFEVYIMAYALLDMLGLSREKGKTVRFHNVQVDSYHSFFASYCDCLVSNDVGLTRKSKILYELFGLDTQVYSIDEFINHFNACIIDNQKSGGKYLNEIMSDYSARTVIDTQQLNGYTFTHIKGSHRYFGYFNYMLERKTENETVIIIYKRQDTKPLLPSREVEIIVNRLVKSFEESNNLAGMFNKEIELPQLLKDQWEGRTWVFQDADMKLMKFKGSSLLCFSIKLENRCIPN